MPLVSVIAHQNASGRAFNPGPTYERPRRWRRVGATRRLTWGVRHRVATELVLTWDVLPAPTPVRVVLTGGLELDWRAHRDDEDLWLLEVL